MDLKLPPAVKKYGAMFGRGAMREFAPRVAKGAILELLDSHQIGVKAVSSMVEKDEDLWVIIGGGNQSKLKDMLSRIGEPDWFTTEWFIEALREERPALSSLFLGWPEAYSWLERQIESFRQNLKS